MSDRSVEDEIAAEGRKFMHAMQAVLSQHAQAANWLERRRVRKQIKQAWRRELYRQDVDRAHQLTWTQSMVDRYRVHSLAVAQRANDPSVDHTRRARDARALTEHADELRGRVIINGRLTEVERGIALDGIDAATTYPEFEPGRLFHRADRIKGVDALRYRAQVARTARGLGIDRDSVRAPYAHVASRPLEIGNRIDEGRSAPANREDGVDPRFVAELGRTAPDGSITIERRTFASELAATSWANDTVSRSRWENGTKLAARIEDTHATSVHTQIPFWAGGQPETVAYRLRDREELLSRDALRAAGQSFTREADGADHARQPDRAEHDRQPETTRQAGEALSPSADRLAELERKVATLQRGLDAVTADRDGLRGKLTEAEAREGRLKNRNLKLAAEIDHKRNQATTPTLDELSKAIGERNKYKRERDQAVAKLAERTAPTERLGSPERQAAALRGGADQPPDKQADRQLPPQAEGDNTQPWPREAVERAVNAATRNGHGRNGIERSR
ncbi:hypothetical protein [Nocardia sp. bgisy118]|uniref:hypothetical protein n=1 Tax=Nocardia sp. bgisy118 TaxID=3413786 RepID=UPI003F4A57FA